MARIISDLAPETVQQRRIAACLRACEGIPTEALEDGIILQLVGACVHIEDERVREVLEKLSALRPRLVSRRLPKKEAPRAAPGPPLRR